MALAQTQFESFHETIKLSYENNPSLREKRDALLLDLKLSLPNDAPEWSWFKEGSYIMNTGIMPSDRNFDIDIGLKFNCSPSEYNDPVELKRIVQDALNGKDRVVKIRNSCITVYYMKNSRPEYHVDLTIYSNDHQRMYFAKGKEDSEKEDREWILFKPNKLSDYIKNCHKNESAEQFQRVVRYMKRWSHKKLVHNHLPSIALTIAASEWIEPNFNQTNKNPRDIYSIRDLTKTILRKWVGSRLSIYLPTFPYNDLMSDVTEDQMLELKRRLHTLESVLQEAIDEPDIHEACRLLRGQFGKDFPVPEKSGLADTINNITEITEYIHN
jgi:hypothetical protein